MISEVFNMDCMEYMKTIPDNYFDIAIVDPPYGINAPKMVMGGGFSGGKYNSNRFKETKILKDRELNQSDCIWDETPPTEEYFKELFRVSKNQIIWGGNYFSLPPTRCVVAWDKCQPWENFSQVELAWTSYDKPAKLYKQMNGGFNCEKKIHPTQKPVPLLEHLIQLYTDVDDVVIDCCAGSGTTLLAAANCGRKAYGFELKRDFVNAFYEKLLPLKQEDMFVQAEREEKRVKIQELWGA